MLFTDYDASRGRGICGASVVGAATGGGDGGGRLHNPPIYGVTGGGAEGRPLPQPADYFRIRRIGVSSDDEL